jgi:hypothetical protein
MSLRECVVRDNVGAEMSARKCHARKCRVTEINIIHQRNRFSFEDLLIKNKMLHERYLTQFNKTKYIMQIFSSYLSTILYNIKSDWYV